MYIYVYICIYIKKIEILNHCKAHKIFINKLILQKNKNLQKEQYI